MSRPHRRPPLIWFSVLVATLVAATSIGVVTPMPGTAAQLRAPVRSAQAASGTGGTSTTRPTALPVYAYFYQWYQISSWSRAKADLPLAGRYSSNNLGVLTTQVNQARSVGIDGFLTSWKDTPVLDRRLDLLTEVAAKDHFDVGVVYEALDFDRKPLPVATVEHDVRTLVSRWGAALRASSFARPVIIWTGTEQYSRADVKQVRSALGGNVLLLAAAKTVAGYENIADLVDGEAYYWSSSDPASPSTAAKLQQMSTAVHARGGLWIAPASPGFDGTTLGHTRVIPRDDGATLRRSVDDAFASGPDAIGVISWNEWSENTYIEPSKRYGTQELAALRDQLAALRGEAPTGSLGSSATGSYGLRLAVEVAAITVVGLASLGWIVRRRRRRPPPGPPPPTGGAVPRCPRAHVGELTSR